MASDMPSIAAQTKAAFGKLGDVLWPRRSLISGVPVRGLLSPDDFAALTFLTSPLCQTCGVPQPIDLGRETVCAACHARPPVWHRARAALAYDDASRRPILALKRAGQRNGLMVMANWMALAGHDLLTDADIIVPVPLHYRRLAQRGFNQAGWLASALSKRSGVPVRHAALARRRATPSQGGLSARARKKNVSGAFSVRASHRAGLAGRKVLLVDDVLTTGATVEAAARALARADVRQTDVLVLARVVRDQDVTI